MERESINIEDVIGSDYFQQEIKEAIQSGKDADYYYDGENEYPVEVYDEDYAIKQVIRVIKKHLIKKSNTHE